MNAAPLLSADDLVHEFAVRRSLADLVHGAPPPTVRALNGVSLHIARGETLAVVGESGCGKTTLARALVRLIELDEGQIDFAGANVRALRGAALRQYNRCVQLVFQDPYGSLNPRILIFDEATSSLDYESERIIQQNMREIAKGRTVFIIAHRLSPVRACDRIVTIERGRLVEDGTHDELIRTGGRYAAFYRMQGGIHEVGIHEVR